MRARVVKPMDLGVKGGLSRRGLLRRAVAVGMTAPLVGAAPRLFGLDANQKLRVAVMGLGRGLGHVAALRQLSHVEIAYLCDVDANRAGSACKDLERSSGKAAQGPQDFRRVLDDKSVDALFVATCNHWHAPATILACAAGKHVYVEKPGSHNAREGELMVSAARKHDRKVQMGNQRRTWPSIREAIEQVRSGVIGKVNYARCWYANQRPSVGRGTASEPPAHLDYALWQGPAPDRSYKSNVIHYNWHWQWHWGGGEMANNGVHALDVARWGLGVDYPVQVSYTGGRYAFDDDQETPDTGVATFDFGGGKGATWEGSSCHPRRGEDLPFVAFYGDRGMLAITDPGFKVFDDRGKLVVEKSGEGGDVGHVANFLAAIRDGAALNAEIEDAQRSTLLCHLANISYRSGQVIRFDPASRRIVAGGDAEKLWSREYRAGWEVSGA